MSPFSLFPNTQTRTDRTLFQPTEDTTCFVLDDCGDDYETFVRDHS